MRRGLVVAATIAIMLTAFLAPSGAVGSEGGWPLAGPARILVGFGESYQTPDGALATHRGVDLAAAPGSEVRCVLPGTVTFAGRVPAGEGATTLAVTIESGEIRLSYMPLAEVDVVSGESLSTDSRIGSLAGFGDRSHGEPHLHLGARRGTLYIDPMPFLIPPSSTGTAEADPAEAPVLGRETEAAASAVSPAPQGTASVSAATSFGGAGNTQQASGTTGLTSTAAQAAASPITEGASAGQATRSSHAAETDQASLEANSSRQVAQGPEVSRTPNAVLRKAGLDPERTRTVLVENRRERALSATPLPRASILTCAGVLATALLWPVWRSIPLVAGNVGPVREDVAAVLTR